MASWSRITVTLVAFVVFVVGVNGDPSAAGPSSSDSSCADTLDTLLPCAPSVHGNYTAPTQDCCDAIKAVSPTCVCFLISTKPAIPDPLKDIDLEAVAKLPKACGLNAHYA